MAISFQNRLLLNPSTTCPRARSLSPKDARTVGEPGHRADLLEPGQLVQKPLGALDVGIVHVKCAEERIEVALQGRDGRGSRLIRGLAVLDELAIAAIADPLLG